MVYNPVGAANGLFAPAHVAGNPEAVAATTAWNANRQAQLHPAMPPDPLGTIDPNTGLPRKGVPTEPTVPPAPPRQWPTGFAPPYTPGNQQSADALAAWNATNRPPPASPATTPPATTPPGAGGPLGGLPGDFRHYLQPLMDRFAANNTTGFSPEAFRAYMQPLTSRFPQMPGGGSFTFTEPTLPPQGGQVAEPLRPPEQGRQMGLTIPSQGQAPAAAPDYRTAITQAIMNKRGSGG